MILAAPWSCLALPLCSWLQLPGSEAENLFKKKKKNQEKVAEDYTQTLRCLNLDWQIPFLSNDNVVIGNLLTVLMNVVREKGMLGKDSVHKVFLHTLVESLLF